MANSENQPQLRHQQKQQKHQSSLLNYSTSSLLLCGVTILLVCGIASGNGNINATGSHNYTSITYAFPTEQRSRRDVANTETEVQQATLVKNVYGDPEELKGNKRQILTSQSIDAERKYDNPFRELNIIKRAPNGFIGMRGKKEHSNSDFDVYNPNAVDWDIDPLYQAKIANNDDTDYDDVVYDAFGNIGRFKKAPSSAFYGVRGKKFSNHNNGIGYNNLNGMLRELEEEHLRERALQDFIGRLAVASAEQNEIIKRAPTGFTGLRGKRPAYNWIANKWQLNTDINDADDADDGFAGAVAGERVPEKRAPTNAFVGVRGKKDVNNQPEPEDVHQNLFKRSPSESFGSGGAGKRRFGDFNNKFVAVRGKKDMKSTDTDATAAQNVRQRLRYLRNVMPALVYGNLKRAPSGFVGMRGKREADVPNEAIFSTAT